ncbi:MAG TPA: hypothetical protein VGR06_25795, partial [Actinophytocola sp.]|uniref:hypothetical protein n=1 Tax=Actinophytocola sp. TaxID=1872138 RepID=UPI002E000C71|nr:hypothetical protein [Actinophytocola sp.]
MSPLDTVPPVVPLTTSSPGISVRRRVLRWARRTEGRLALLLVLMVVLGVAAGAAGFSAVRDRVSRLDGVQEGSQLPALQLYVNLANADATVSAAFLSGGATADELGRFRWYITEATKALTKVAAVSRSSDVSILSTELPLYAGQVEDALLAYNRPGVSPEVSSRLADNYIREPAIKARTAMLPPARSLHEEELVRLSSAQREVAALPWLALGFGALLIACLIAVQIQLTRLTRRRLNLYLLVATAAAFAAVTWLGVASTLAASHSEVSRRDGTAQITVLAATRVAGLQARSDEAMILIANDNGPNDFVSFYYNNMTVLTAAFAQASAVAAPQPETCGVVEAAPDPLWCWLGAHLQLQDFVRAGQTAGAVALLSGRITDLSRSIDDQLTASIGQATERLATHAEAAREA